MFDILRCRSFGADEVPAGSSQASEAIKNDAEQPFSFPGAQNV
jgi:hypothetical protein